MKVIVCENYEELSNQAAKIVSSQLIVKPNSILGLATGSTPIGLYQNLIDMNKKGEIDFSEVKTYNLDEYYPIKKSNDQSYDYFMNEQLFSHINIDKNNTHLPNGEAEDPVKECERYEKMLDAIGGVDLQILGIGQNGHIAFNEPDENLIAVTHLTGLTQSTIEANSRFFASADEVPKQALTMGMGSILKAKKIVILANGANKSKAVAELLNDNITTSNPATMLKVHPDVTLICDKEAFSAVK
jgi:glucosamine-6-phosphate deaminase